MSLLDRDYTEKRDFIRMKINSAITVRQQDAKYEGICRDLSGAGLLVEIDRAFSVGDELDVYIAPGDEGHAAFGAKVEVTRTDATDNGLYIIGLAIKQITE